MLIYTLIVYKCLGKIPSENPLIGLICRDNPEKFASIKSSWFCVCDACSPFTNKEKITIGCVDFAYLRENQQS